jgi:peroxiredoxin Q/BCP
MTRVAVGKRIPAFDVPATGDRTVSSKELAGQAYVLYFYPKDSTPGCTTEGENFRDAYGRFKRRKIAVFGVSRDDLRSHARFKEKYGFPFDLLSDRDETLCGIFGVVKDKNMYGKKVRGIERSTFLIDAQGRLVHEWRKVKIPGHVEEVLEAAGEL